VDRESGKKPEDGKTMMAIGIENLQVRIGGKEILKGIDFSLNENTCIGIVGESGSGKTMFVRSLMGLLPLDAQASGAYSIDGEQIDLSAKEREWKKIRGRELGMVMQDPFTALDPQKKCGRQILDGVPKAQRRDFNVNAALEEVGLNDNVAEKYPSELSGGMRQRVVIAAALATTPRLLIADEATTALDVITQKEILDLLDTIRASRNMPLLLITHNIRLARERTDSILVMDKGEVVEAGPTEQVIGSPKEDATRILLEADRFLRSGDYTAQTEGKVVLDAQGIKKSFGACTAVDGVSIRVHAGEIVGVVGQSGSGKTTLARCIVGLAAVNEGKIEYHGNNHPQIVFQDPYSSLNPSHKVREILEEALSVSGRPKSELAELLRLAEIPEELLERRPARLSGGQRQRVAIARALAPRPELLICDESVSALDLVVQNQILTTLQRLSKERGLAILFITHDLSVVRMLASRVYVMHEAKIVCEGDTESIFKQTSDEYTRKLIEASAIGAEVNTLATLYRCGRIYTVDGDGWENSPCEAMAVGADGRILYVGDETGAKSVLGCGYKTVDLEGRAVLPGFVDSHVHMPGSALTELYGAYLYPCKTIAETLSVVKEYINANPERDCYFGTGFFMSITDDPTELRRELLDEIEPDRPVILDSSDGHVHWINTAALRALGIDSDTKSPPGGLIGKDPETGEPTGLLSDAGKLISLKQEYCADDCISAMKHYQKKQLGWGYTAVMHVAPHMCRPEILAKLSHDSEWKLRTNISANADNDKPIEEAIDEATALSEIFEMADVKNNPVRVSTVKFFIDGVVEGMTAWLKEPYAPESGAPADYCSQPLWDLDELTKAFATVTAAGYQIHAHSIGDAATDEALKALRMARDITGMPEGSRDVITHLQILGQEEISRMKEMDIIASFQPFWCFKEPFWYDEVDERILGRERAEAAYPVASVLKEGIRITFSGDYPVSPINDPFWAIQNAVTRNLSDPDRYGVEAIDSPDDPKWLRGPEQRITLKAAIEAYTINGAYQLFRDEEIGSLASGKYADFIVLSGDPFETDSIYLYKIKPEMVYIAGEPVI